MEQFEQLLTCCVCLDRYRNPKLLPCQHSFCMEPCMEGLVDYVRRQVKCPECRAEHRIPYQGVQAFPTNVTLQRFLELHIEITGELPDPTSGQVMERCSVCSEKAYLSPCAHCDKKICEDCKSAHMDILRREINRINSQIRRSLHRLQDSLAVIEKNTLSLQTNCISVSEEIEEIYRRVTKAIKDRSEHLKGEIDRYLTTELRNLTSLKENLDSEINNIASNCDVADKYMNETVEWDDCELMDTKEIFLKTVEFLRNFEYENADYSRRVRFLVSMDPNQLVMNLATFGDLNITPHAHTSSTTSSSHLAPPSTLQPGLMRSKSDHRLATQFRQQEERGYDDEPALGGRKFGERRERYGGGDTSSSSRYGRTGGDYDYDYESEQSRPSKSRFRSRFVRSHQNDDSDTEPQRPVRPEKEVKDRDRVLDTEDVSRGQLSGIIRLSDCPRVIKRLSEQGKEKKEKKETPVVPPTPKPVAARKSVPPVATRQMSEEDEISRIKRQNKGATSTAAVAAAAAVPAVVEPERPTADRVAALKRNTASSNTTSTTSEESDSSHRASPARRTPSRTEADSDSEEESDGSITSPQQPKTTTPAISTATTTSTVKKPTRSASSDSTASTESSSSAAATSTPTKSATTTTATADTRSRYTPRESTTRETSSARAAATTTPVPEKKPFVSRFLPNHTRSTPEKKTAESESSTEEETSSEESEDETSKKPPVKVPAATTPAATGSTYRERLEARRNSRDEANRPSSYVPNTSGYSSPSTTRTRPTPAAHHDTDDRYGASGSSKYKRHY